MTYGNGSKRRQDPLLFGGEQRNSNSGPTLTITLYFASGHREVGAIMICYLESLGPTTSLFVT
jgi:hypothetical protein